jgi:hypothetical protein
MRSLPSRTKTGFGARRGFIIFSFVIQSQNFGEALRKKNILQAENALWKTCELFVERAAVDVTVFTCYRRFV